MAYLKRQVAKLLTLYKYVHFLLIFKPYLRVDKDIERNHGAQFNVFTLGNEEIKTGYIPVSGGTRLFEGNENSI